MLNNDQKQNKDFKNLEIKIKNDEYLIDLCKKNNFIFKYNDINWFLKYNEILVRYFYSQKKLCKTNKNKNFCLQTNKGFQEKIIIKNNCLVLVSEECNCTLINKIKKYFLFFNFDQKYLQYTFNNNCYLKPSRNNLIVFFAKWLKKIIDNKLGIYIFGEPNIGKTFISILFANNIASKQKKTICFITSIELISFVKEKVINNKLTTLKSLNFFMNVDVLFLDDIGGEKVTQWSRDEVLFPFLNFRMNKNKATFFTSNFSIKQLVYIYQNVKINYSYSQNNELKKIEKMKSLRLVRRIKSLCYKNYSFNLDKGCFEKN